MADGHGPPALKNVKPWQGQAIAGAMFFALAVVFACLDAVLPVIFLLVLFLIAFVEAVRLWLMENE